MHRPVGDSEPLGEVGGRDHDCAGGKCRGCGGEIARVNRVGAMLGRELLDAMLLPGHDQHAAPFVALVERLAHERIEATDIAVHPAPSEVRRKPGVAGRLAEQLEGGEAIERREQIVDIDEARGCAMGQLAPSLLLEAQPLDLPGVAFGRSDQPLAAAIEQHDRIIEVIQQRRRGVATEVREEEVEALLVHARRQQVAIALPLLTNVAAECRGVQPADGRERPGHQLAAEVELACRPDLRGLELGDELLRGRVEGAQVLDVVAEPFGAPRSRAIHPEDVDDAASHCEIPWHGDCTLAPVAELDKACDQGIAGEPRAALHLGQAGLDHRARERRPEQPAR